MNPQDTPSEIIGQSPGCDPKSTSATKRNSGLFAFLKWFKPSTSRESINTQNSSSCESLNSTISNGTVASFSYINPSAYPNKVSEKCIILEPETDTYKARLKQRDRRRENDKNLTLRKKYNLFFNRDTFLRANNKKDEESTKSLPLMTRAMEEQEEKTHRRTNSESSKLKKAGAYVHVRGKRRAPQPPGTLSNSSTLSLRRKKRNAPAPPTVEKIKTTPNTEVLFNDCLKLDHGVLKPAKEEVKTEPSSARSSYVSDGPVSPRPWYKRNNTKRESHKYETVEILPEITARNSTVDLTIEETIKQEKPKKEESKRKSGMSFLTNISELDREASEIIKNEHQKNGNDLPEIPEFMRPKGELKINTESWVSPKRRSAKDLIAKFNAITNVTKVTVNTALFGSSQNPRKEHFKKRVSLSADRKQESLLESHKKRIDQIKNNHPLMKSESASAIKTPQPETPKMERKNWNCPKCKLENEYWRIICHMCSAIKPYFDDFSSSKETSTNEAPGNTTGSPEKFLERSKTQIGFSALASYNKNKRVEKSISLEEKTSKESDNTKEEEREKLKKMLIEMKNSLPKRKSNILLKQASNRTSVIMENPENIEENEVVKKEKTSANHKLPEEKVASVLIGTTQTIYENIKVKKSDQPAATKVLSSLQTKVDTSVSNANFIASPIVKAEEIRKEENKKAKVKEIQKQPELLNRELIRKNSYELMRPKDFENIYSDNAAQSPARIYANLARNDELSLFFNMPKNFAELKNNLSKVDENNTDTIEINRLLRRLESAIAKGEMTEAAIYAKELAQLKINCSVVRQKPHPNSKKKGFSIEMYVEDKISHRGPFTLEVIENQTVAELKQQVEQEFEIPVEVQRWILGKELATDDHATLKDHQITSERCPVFLYLVAPSENKLVDTKLNRCKNEEVPSTSKTELNVKNDLKTTVCVEETNDRIPKIVEVIPKVTERIPKIEPGPSTEKTSVHKSTRTIELKTDKNTSGNGFEPKNGVLKKPEVKNDEDDEEYDTKTLRPQPKEWECHLCTLLNPIGSNVCAVCATVKQIEPISSKKSLKKTKAPQPIKKEPKVQTYQQLMNLDNADLVENTETFECVVCFMDILPGQGVTLRECLHQFCKLCLANTIEYTEDAEVKCPYRDDQYSCNIALQDREIKALVTPQVYEHYLAKSVTEAENKIGRSFHCKTPDCRGWCIFEDKVNEFRCPVCTRVNCLTCQAIHIGMNCRQYQEKFKRESEVDDDARRTKDMVDEMVSKGEALTCPTCKVILMKKWGCDWVRCSMCKTEICWVTRGPRWGPAGKGDTSGGCQCGVNGVKCHPQCSYCH